MAAEATQTQYYVGFGSCNSTMQNQAFSNWVMYRPRTQQQPGSLSLFLDTRNMGVVADATGNVVPREFPLNNMYFAYFNNRAVQKLDEALSNPDTYTQTSSWYRIHINGKRVTTVMDMKNTLTGANTTSAPFSLKSTLNGVITPSTALYNITISKNCGDPVACAAIPEPVDAFVSPSTDTLVFSFWTVNQPLTINGFYKRDHAWCPVKTAVNVEVVPPPSVTSSPPPARGSSPSPSRSSSAPLAQAASSPPPQYYIGFGSCNASMQNAMYGTWLVARLGKEQSPGSLVFILDTLNKPHARDIRDNLTVTPKDFTITNMYFAYFNSRAVQGLNAALANPDAYVQTPSHYRVHVNGQRLSTVMDMKNTLAGSSSAFSMFSLNLTLNGIIAPSRKPYLITITKNCAGAATAAACAAIPEPSEAFVSPAGHVVYSLWSPDQPLAINGSHKKDNAWCPVQTAANPA
ncbi:hypothetical protein PLESTF_001371300 [Pleodorina starrii]|nr:hypothetical protein PLESTF_001371300 [Pleodorina starrii]